MKTAASPATSHHGYDGSQSSHRPPKAAPSVEASINQAIQRIAARARSGISASSWPSWVFRGIGAT
jgi:hypothetical protein